MTAVMDYERGGADSLQEAGIPDHQGQARTKPADFFAPPPPEIGPILSAESTLPKGKRFLPLYVRFAISAIVAAVTWTVLTLALQDPKVLGPAAPILAGLLAVVIFGCMLLFLRIRYACTYVGRDGACRFNLNGSRTSPARQYMLLFNQAAELRAHQVRQHYNGIYVGTNYDYRWTDPSGRLLYRLRGSYRAAKMKRPKKGSNYNFAMAAELAWSKYYLARADAQLKSEGSIPFRIDARKLVRVGPGFLEFHFGDQPVRVTKDEIASVSLGNGTFSFKHKDAKWYSRAGKFSFSYGRMANARVFLLALDKLMGYRWS